MSDIKRVVITGMGVVSPLGNTLTSFWENIVIGKSASGKITRFNAEPFRTNFACEVKDFDPAHFLDRGTIKRTDLFTQYALAASDQAIADAGFDSKLLSPFDIGGDMGEWTGRYGNL